MVSFSEVAILITIVLINRDLLSSVQIGLVVKSTGFVGIPTVPTDSVRPSSTAVSTEGSKAGFRKRAIACMQFIETAVEDSLVNILLVGIERGLYRVIRWGRTGDLG